LFFCDFMNYFQWNLQKHVHWVYMHAFGTNVVQINEKKRMFYHVGDAEKKALIFSYAVHISVSKWCLLFVGLAGADEWDGGSKRYGVEIVTVDN
jgi:hypothetical protein